MTNIKELIKKNEYLYDLYSSAKYGGEFKKDKKFFLKNYIHNYETVEQIEYALLLEIHKLEKGMSSRKLRPFGKDKIKKIISLLGLLSNKSDNKSFAYNLSLSVLLKYKEVYENNNWNDLEEYEIVSKYISDKKIQDVLPSGAFDLKFDDIKNALSIDYYSFLKSRHSVRNFANKKLSPDDVKKAVEMAILSPSACNRQMCKIYQLESDGTKKLIEKYAQGFGLFQLENANYFLITFDTAANYFVGERNQGWFNAGLMSMNFVNALHSLGIGSCFVQFGNSFDEEELIKRELNIPKSERIAVIVVAGYYDDISRIPYSTRKNIDDILFIK